MVAARKPAQRRKRAVRAVPPAIVEQIREKLLDDERVRDATLVSVHAYAGRRPGEALALTWRHGAKRTILVERAAGLGEIKESSSERRGLFGSSPRSVVIFGSGASSADARKMKLSCSEVRRSSVERRRLAQLASTDLRSSRERASARL